MDENDLHYAAGLFDGEGSITLIGRTGKMKSLRVSVSSTCPDLLLFMQRVFGGKIYNLPVRVAHYRPQQEWILIGRKAVEFLVIVRPLLRETRKRARADAAIDLLEPLMPSTGINLSANDRLLRKDVERLILSI